MLSVTLEVYPEIYVYEYMYMQDRSCCSGGGKVDEDEQIWEFRLWIEFEKNENDDEERSQAVGGDQVDVLILLDEISSSTGLHEIVGRGRTESQL